MFKKILTSGFIFISLLSNLTAQVYYFKKYTTSDGLVQGTIRVISQDSFGRMWFGTAEGVSIYDGFSFYNYGIDDGLPVPVITSFLEVAPGVMLVGTLGSGIAVFEKTPFKKDIIKTILNNKKYLISPYVSQITRDAKGNIWIFTDEGISEWIFKDSVFTQVRHQDKFGKLGKLNILRAAFTDNGESYYATDIGLVRKHNDQYEFVYPDSTQKKEPVFYVYFDKDKRLWFTTINKLYFLKENKITDFSKSHPEITVPSISYCEDRYGNLRIGMLGSIFLFNGNRLETINHNNGLTETSIISLFYDNENNLWIGSLDGMSKLTNTNLKFIKNQKPQTYFTSDVTQIDDKLLIGSNLDLYEIKDFSLAPSTFTVGIGKASYNRIGRFNNDLWFATDRGVFVKNKSGVLHFTKKDGLPHNFIYNIKQDLNGIVWIGSQSGLAYCRNGQIFNFSNKSEEKWNFSDSKSKNILSNTSIRWLIVGEDNSVWVGSWADGLFRIKADSIFRFTEKNGLNDLHIRGLYIDSKKKLWVGTRYGGVFICDNGNFQQLSIKDGLSSNWVFSILEDDFNNYWFSTANGVNKFDGKHWLKFDASDGISSGEIKFSTKVESDLWFCSWSQIFCYNTGNNYAFDSKPNIHFTQIRLLDGELPDNPNSDSTGEFRFEDLGKQTISKNEIIELTYSNNTLFFEFAGTSFKDESNVRYDYKLEGFDINWTLNTQRNYLSYTHLPPGKYSFKVYAINKEGLKSSNPAVFNFIILAPFWQRWWFITLSLIVFVLIVSLINYIIYQYKIRQALKVEILRTKISSDLHDEIGTSLSSIAIFTQLIKRESKSGSIRAVELLERIENTSRDLIDKMSDIVWAVNPGNDKFEDALLKLKDYSVKILESKGINLEFNLKAGNEKIILPMDVRRNLLSIFKEVVTNSAKYSNASTVRIDLRFYEKPTRKILLSIEDNGVGFDIIKQVEGNGLKNIKHRSNEINAKLQLNSSPGKGTKVIIEIPI